MLADRYGLGLSTASGVARDAYEDGRERLLTHYPGAIEAFDRAIAADPGFALAHAGRAQVMMREGKGAAAQAALAEAQALGAGLSAREASHLGVFARVLGGGGAPAIAALRAHLADWPRDVMVVAVAANPNGLIGASGRVGQKRMIAELLDGLAPAFGDDAWFLAHHAMALSEAGQRAAARPLIARSLAQTTHNAQAAHTQAHLFYEDGEADAALAFLRGWLADYPREGFFHGHLNWHLALVELAAGQAEAALARYRDALTPDRHSGPPQQRVTDGAAFLWRWELAGHPRDAAAWALLQEVAGTLLPRPGNGFADLHVMMTRAVAADAADAAARVAQMAAMTAEGRYASGDYVPALAAGFAAFARQDWDAAIALLAPLQAERERVGGSLAQHDIIEFTLLRACLAAGRLDEARRVLAARRAGPGQAGTPVAGIDRLH